MCVHYILRALRVGLHLTRTYPPRRKVVCYPFPPPIFFGGGRTEPKKYNAKTSWQPQ